MAIVYHFANPDIVKIILLIDFIFLTFIGIQLRKKEENLRKSSFFILSGLLPALWYLIFLFIPAFMFTTPPTADEIQFGNLYMLIIHNIIPGCILIISLGIIDIFIGLNNKENYGKYLIISGIFAIISIFLGIFAFIFRDILDSTILTTIASIIMGIALFFYLYFAIKIKEIYLSIFCIIYLFCLFFPLIMPEHYITIF